jgi:FAD/FMN-containing dehydrogenase
VHPHGKQAQQLAGLGEDNDELVRAAYAQNQDKLARVKQRYDPHNLFRGNVNIAPARPTEASSGGDSGPS